MIIRNLGVVINTIFWSNLSYMVVNASVYSSKSSNATLSNFSHLKHFYCGLGLFLKFPNMF